MLCFGQTLIAIDGSGAEDEGEEHTSAPDAGGQGEGRLGEKGTRSQPGGHEVGENGKGQPPDEPGQPIRPGGQAQLGQHGGEDHPDMIHQHKQRGQIFESGGAQTVAVCLH